MTRNSLHLLHPNGKPVIFNSEADFHRYADSQTITPKRYAAGGWILDKIDIHSFSKADALLLTAGFWDLDDIPKIYAYGLLKIRGLIANSSKAIEGNAVLTEKYLVFAWSRGLIRHFAIFEFPFISNHQVISPFQSKFKVARFIIRTRQQDEIRIEQEIVISPIFGKDGQENRRTFSLWCSFIARLLYGLQNE